MDQALNLNSSLDWDHLFSFATLVFGIPYNKDPTSSVSSIIKNNISLFNSSKINANAFSNLSNPNIFHPSSTVDDSKRLRDPVNAKLIEGDVSAAVRVLTSSDTILATKPEVLTALRRKHPAPPSDVRFVQMENNDSNIEISKRVMVAALKSFSGSSSGSVNGLRPGHINDYPHCRSRYPSILIASDNIISSVTGIQQSDPHGPLLFAMAVDGVARSITSPFDIWYIDDATLGGSIEAVAAEL
ncbi:unnamed protein product [Acanthosepion pharaonis]|uniref:Uncharacterized protein n=1 Tax=Acanthosepion pharaonis TaxID=158019 RepID=A0A812E968_ACAPH|nr:unnamed protein product [Sepia pharaonis]